MIKLLNTSFKYGNKEILNHVNLTINNGDFYFVFGENGSGKSTFIKLILSLLKPSCGKVISDYKRIGYLHQDLNSINSSFPVTVKEILYSHIKISNLENMKKKSCINDQIDSLLKIMNIESLKNKTISSLSGGQFQKVLITRAFINNPDIVILDEPSNNLDKDSIDHLYKYLQKINENGTTVIVTEHTREIIMNHFHNVLFFDDKNIEILSSKEFQHFTERSF